MAGVSRLFYRILPGIRPVDVYEIVMETTGNNGLIKMNTLVNGETNLEKKPNQNGAA
jgi:hypothetical protein